MSALWPGFLLLLILIPLLIAAYIWILRRRRPFAVRYSSLSLVREAAPRARWRRHVPFALFLVALTSLIAAMARPVSIISVPTNKTTILLAIDVSRSMCSSDIAPNRLAAAQEAALNFVRGQRPGTQIGIVAFAGFAELIQRPTTDQKALEDAIKSLITGQRTAIGSGIMESIDAISDVDENVAPSTSTTSRGPEPTPVPRGAYAPDIIVLLTDGASNAGPSPVAAAQQAVDRGIRVYTIGFGTAQGSEMPVCPSQLVGGEPFGGNGGFGGFGGGGGGGRGGFRRGIDEATLKRVASMTDGEYYSAESSNELLDVFRKLPTSLITKHEVTEISFAFATFGALMAVVAVFLSMRWNPFP